MDEQLTGQNDQVGASSRPSIGRVMGIALVLVAGVAALYLLIGYFAWQNGQTLRTQQEEQLQMQQYERQVALAREDIKNGSYDLALRRIEWVLEHEPQNEAAIALRGQAQAALKTALTPDAPLQPTAEPEPTTAIDDDEINPEDELARLRRLYDREQWQTLLPEVLAMQQQYPDYERMETNRFLYKAYLNLGLQQIQGNQIEHGISNFAKAERLGDLPQEALDYWFWADLYLEGISYYGVNWAVSSSVFRELCLSAPFFQNSCDKLFESLVNYGDQYLFNQDYCPAVEVFREARQYGSDPTLSDKLTKAVDECALATPTPDAITGTIPVTGTEPLPLTSPNE